MNTKQLLKSNIRLVVEDVIFWRMDDPFSAGGDQVQCDLWAALMIDHTLFGADHPSVRLMIDYPDMIVDLEGNFFKRES